MLKPLLTIFLLLLSYFILSQDIEWIKLTGKVNVLSYNLLGSAITDLVHK